MSVNNGSSRGGRPTRLALAKLPKTAATYSTSFATVSSLASTGGAFKFSTCVRPEIDLLLPVHAANRQISLSFVAAK